MPVIELPNAVPTRPAGPRDAIIAAPVYPESRGKVSLRTAALDTEARIRHNYLEAEEDRWSMIAEKVAALVHDTRTRRDEHERQR